MNAPAMPIPRALRRAALVDSFTYSLYACAPYRGCGHGCAYCDGRAEKYYVEGDFQRDIMARQDLPERLAAELPGLREWGSVSLGSGVTDAYQPCEETHRLTRCLVEALSLMPDHREAGGLGPLPVVILTKSSRILEDLDLWSRINTRAAVLVLVSITSLNEELREIFEPGASPFQERLEVLRRFKAAGCLTGALVMPFLPGITDDDAAMRSLFGQLKVVGVDFALAGGLTLRPGRQKEHFFKVLREHRPDLEGLYHELYREERPSGSPVWAHRREQQGRIEAARKDIELPWLLPHKGLRRLLQPHDELAVVFWQMGELYQAHGVDTARLRRAGQRYEAWLKTCRTEFRRRRQLPSGWLTMRLEQATESGELAQVLDNAKLARFAQRILRDRSLLNPVTLQLMDP